MRRAIVLGATMLALGGCEKRMVEAESKVAADEKAAERYEAVEVRAVQQRMEALRTELEEHEQAAAQAEQQLRELHKALAQTWSGNADEMKVRLSAAAVPATLVKVLEAAQSAAASTTAQARFEHALEAENYGEVETLMAGSEVAAGITPDEAPPAEGPECEHESLALTCQGLPSDDPKLAGVQLCQGGGSSYLACAEDGALAVRQLHPPGEIRLVRSIARDWWMIRREHASPITARSADRADEVQAMAWIGFLQLSSDGATERMAIAAEAKGGPVAFEPSDLDGDGTAEIVVVAPDQVRAVHHDRRVNDLSVWTPEETCRALAGGGVAAIGRERCAEFERKAREAEAAAARLAEAIAKAPAPAKVLEEVREALLRCDQARVLGHVSKSLLVQLEKDKAKDGPEKLEKEWKGLCGKLKEDERRVRALVARSTDVVGGVATVEVQFPEESRTEKLRLVFDGTAWKLEPENLPKSD